MIVGLTEFDIKQQHGVGWIHVGEPSINSQTNKIEHASFDISLHGSMKDSIKTMDGTGKKTIKFNVGGTKYEISQSLLDRYPSCMLSTICSKTWVQADAGTATVKEAAEEIFIDRNGQRFQYVLDYMRDSRVELPLSIPRSQFVTDMEFFGLDYKEESIILSPANARELFHSLSCYRDYFTSKSEEIEAGYKSSLDCCHDYFVSKSPEVEDRYLSIAAERMAYQFAQEYFVQLKRKACDTKEEFFRPTKVTVAIFPSHKKIVGSELLQKHIQSFGLRIEVTSYSSGASAESVEVIARISLT